VGGTSIARSTIPHPQPLPAAARGEGSRPSSPRSQHRHPWSARSLARRLLRRRLACSLPAGAGEERSELAPDSLFSNVASNRASSSFTLRFTSSSESPPLMLERHAKVELDPLRHVRPDAVVARLRIAGGALRAPAGTRLADDPEREVVVDPALQRVVVHRCVAIDAPQIARPCLFVDCHFGLTVMTLRDPRSTNFAQSGPGS
jgi:hypothetical protein